MKIFTIISIITLCIFFNSKGYTQNIEAQVFVQKTIVGIQKGYSIRNVNNKGVKFGVFHQSTKNLSFNEGERNYPYTGAEISYPISNCGKIKLYANLKAGLLNNQFIVAIPEFETSIRINKFLNTSIATSIRAGEAAMAIKVSINPF